MLGRGKIRGVAGTGCLSGEDRWDQLRRSSEDACIADGGTKGRCQIRPGRVGACSK